MTLAAGPIDTYGLPIPQTLVDALEDGRRAAINGISETLKKLHKELSDGKYGCSASCRLSLHRAAFEHADMWILQDNPWEKFKVKKAQPMLNNIKAPYTTFYKGWKGPYLKARDGYQHRKKYSSDCNLAVIMQSLRNGTTIPELDMESFRLSMMPSRRAAMGML